MKKIKNLRHKKIDLHLQYQCPECGCLHWLSISENKTKNFIIKCECGIQIRVKKIDKIFFEYETNEEKPKQSAKTFDNLHENIPTDLHKKCVQALSNYGYIPSEVNDFINQAFKDTTSFDIKILVTETIKLIGARNVSLSQANHVR